MADRRLPLAGVQVVSLEQAVAMPYCSFVLAEMGANVIKIEKVGTGDVLRGWDRAVDGLSTGYVWLNANKKDLAVDLASDRGRRVAQQLCATADVFLENFAPGVASRLGLDYPTLVTENPGLIYVSLSGYGNDGPFRDIKAYDLLIQGESGLLLTNGYPDAPSKISIPVCDIAGGSNAALAVVIALFDRERTGRGGHIDVSMFDATLNWLGYFPQHWWHGASEPPRSGMRHQYLAPYGPFLAADGKYVNLVIARDEHWEEFCRKVVDRPEWIDDARLNSMSARSQNRDYVDGLVEDVFTEQPSEFWFERLQRARLPFGSVRSIGDAVNHPQTAWREMVVTADSPVGEVNMIRFPLADPSTHRTIPDFGEHSRQLLVQLGYSDDDISSLVSDGIIGLP